MVKVLSQRSALASPACGPRKKFAESSGGEGRAGPLYQAIVRISRAAQIKQA